MQAQAMRLIGSKMTAAQAIEGKFTSEGLVAMADDEDVAAALAKTLLEHIDEREERGLSGSYNQDSEMGDDFVVEDSFSEELEEVGL